MTLPHIGISVRRQELTSEVYRRSERIDHAVDSMLAAHECNSETALAAIEVFWLAIATACGAGTVAAGFVPYAYGEGVIVGHRPIL